MDGVAVSSRREALALVGGSALASALMASGVKAAPVASATPDLKTKAGIARAYMMMRGALDDRLVIGCVTGRYYGVLDAVLTPLFGVCGATLTRYRPSAGFAYEAVTCELAYFTDLATGAAIERYNNPYTGQSVDVPAVRSTPMRIRITQDLSLELDKPLPGLELDHKVHAPEMRGDDLWITEVTRTSATTSGKPFHYSESTTLHARMADFHDPAAKRVRCETSFTNVVDWRPWLKMSNHPGHMMAIGAGRYGATMAELPPAWVDATQRRHPDVLTDPAAALEPLWSAK